MTDLIAFRNIMHNLLGSAVDSATWTDRIIDEALRLALHEYEDLFVVESSFTVITTAETQDLSTISNIKDIFSVSYPWSEGADYQTFMRDYRLVSDHNVYFHDIEPQATDTIRVRHTRTHTIEDLDSAASTTIPSRHERYVAYTAVNHALRIRIRQITENPAIPSTAINHLATLITHNEKLIARLIPESGLQSDINWSTIGL